jgi:hypothetical protein
MAAVPVAPLDKHLSYNDACCAYDDPNTTRPTITGKTSILVPNICYKLSGCRFGGTQTSPHTRGKVCSDPGGNQGQAYNIGKGSGKG